MTLLKKSFLGLSLMILYSYPAVCQNSSKLFHHSGQYRLNLPEEWMKPKMIKAVTDVLAETIDELKMRDFCTEGTASYYILLIIDSLNFVERSFSFHAALRTYDSIGKVVADLKLVSPEEVFEAKQKKISNSSVYQEPGNDYNIYDDSGNVIAKIPTFSIPIIIENSNSSLLDFSLLNICKKRVFQTKKLLRHLISK